MIMTILDTVLPSWRVLRARRTTIHLLSGGEKAMTAIALVFSIFQLNPAPFCMLDEVMHRLTMQTLGDTHGLF